MILPSVRLDGKVAIVTGGGGGIGTLAACAFAEAGADVVVVARTATKCEATADMVRRIGGRAWVIPTDVTSADAVQNMLAQVERDCGRVDILLNNAGVTSPKTLEESTEDEWFGVIKVNVKVTFLVTKAVLPMMKAQRSGRIINMGSILSKVGMVNRTAYSASKAAVAQITRSLALELGPFGINVNALGPSVIVTNLNRDLIEKQPQIYADLLKRMPLGRFGRPEDLAGPLVFLASDASAFVTGQILYVDGGYTAA